MAEQVHHLATPAFGGEGRYMSAESLARARLDVIEGEVFEGVRGELVAAS